MQDDNLYEVKNIYEELKEEGKLDEKNIQNFERFLKEKDDKVQEKYMMDRIKNLLYLKREEVIKIQKLMKS